MSAYEQIRAQLKAVKRWWVVRRTTGALVGAFWVTVVAVTLGGLALGLWPHPALRLGILLAWAAGVAALLAFDALFPVVGLRRDESFARLLERREPALRNDLTSSLQFGDVLGRGDAAAASSVGSPALMRAFVDETAVRFEAEAPRLRQVLPRGERVGLRRAGMLATLALGILFVALPGTFRPGLAYLLTATPPPGHGPIAPAAARAEPLVGRIIATYRYPLYTGRAQVRLANPSGRIDVLAGTEVRLEALSLVPTGSAALLLRTGPADGEIIETEIGTTVEGRELSVSFTPLQSGRYTFEITDPNGLVRRDPLERIITVTPDAEPLVRVTSPETVVEAGANDVVPFHFTVSDDFGLTELAFVHSFGAGEAAAATEGRDVLAALQGDLVLQEAAGFDLTRLNLQPRDEILVFVEAVDNDTISGPKAGRSQAVLIRIASPEDRHLQLVEREEAVFEALLDVLGDYLENPIADLRRDGADLQFELGDLSSAEWGRRFTAAQQISQKVQTVLGDMRELLGLMENDELLLRRDYEIFRSIYDRLYGLQRDEQGVLLSLQRPASQNQLGRHHMSRVEAVRAPQVRETERAILDLEELIASQRMESMVRTLEELDQIQDRLRELLEQYRDTQDPNLRAEIERELMRLEARMRELMQRLAEQMEQLPAEHYNIEALQQMGEMSDVSQMADALEQLRQMIEEGNIEAAMQQLDNLAAEIDAMLQQMNQSEEAGGSGMSELDQRISELIDEINNLEAQESEIEQATAELQEEIRQRRVQALEQQLESFVQDARERVAEMRRELGEIGQDPMRSATQESLDEADRQLEQLDEQLEARDFESSLQHAEGVMDQLAQAAFQLGGQVRRIGDESPRARAVEQARQGLEGVQGEAQELAEDLEELMEQARPTPEAQDQPRLDDLAQQQQRTLEELQQLRQRLQEMGQDMPMLDQFGEGLQRVEGFMQGAGRQLQGQRLQGAREDEQSALQQLRQMRQQMHQMVQQQRMGSRGRQSAERVEIPEEAEETPAEFREDLLDAMREGSLQTYEEAIRQYYESLVE